MKTEEKIEPIVIDGSLSVEEMKNHMRMAVMENPPSPMVGRNKIPVTAHEFGNGLLQMGVTEVQQTVDMLNQYNYKPVPHSVQVINDSSIEDLCSEYNNIMLKKSKLSANQRALVQQRVQHLLQTGDIKAFKSIAEK